MRLPRALVLTGALAVSQGAACMRPLDDGDVPAVDNDARAESAAPAPDGASDDAASPPDRDGARPDADASLPLDAAAADSAPDARPDARPLADVAPDHPVVRTPPGGTLVAYVPVEGIGDIAVQIATPATARYGDGAGVVVEVNTFFTGNGAFYTSADTTRLGLIHVSYLWPGNRDPSGARSDGTYGNGSDTDLRALRDVVRFAAGELPDRDGHTLGELLATPIARGALGLYAFSHPGIAAVNVLALHAAQLGSVSYFVGRENPTTDTLSSVEVGYFDDAGRAVLNPLYRYPGGYTPTDLSVDYSSVRWDASAGRPYFDLDHSGTVSAPDHVLGTRIPTMFGVRFYSDRLTQALRANGLSAAAWPADLATPEQTAALWPSRESPARLGDLAALRTSLHAMLVFADRDHVQPAADKPHIHMVWQGLRERAGVWTRLNPDAAYIAWAFGAAAPPASPDTDANATLPDAAWTNAATLSVQSAPQAQTLVPLAGIAEMSDRAHEGRWESNLSAVLVSAPAP